MKIIAHRGNLNGKSHETENTLSQVNYCIRLGYEVEIDLRLIGRDLMLGHDEAVELVTKEDLIPIADKLWIHCKNIEALELFSSKDYGNRFNFFWHENDCYTLTSKGYIWSYPGAQLSCNCICVMPELNVNNSNLTSLDLTKSIGVCSDYPVVIASNNYNL